MKQQRLAFGGTEPMIFRTEDIGSRASRKAHRSERAVSRRAGRSSAQLGLDMGQRVVGIDCCVKCGMHFNRTPADVKVHNAYCAGLTAPTGEPRPSNSWGSLTKGLSACDKPAALQLKWPSDAHVWAISAAQLSAVQRMLLDEWMQRIRLSRSASQCSVPTCLAELCNSPVLDADEQEGLSVAVATAEVGGVVRAVGVAVYTPCHRCIPVATHVASSPTRRLSAPSAFPDASTGISGTSSDAASGRSESPEPHEPNMPRTELVVASAAIFVLDLLFLPEGTTFSSQPSPSEFFQKRNHMNEQPPQQRAVLDRLLDAIAQYAIYGCVVQRSHILLGRHLLLTNAGLLLDALPRTLATSVVRSDHADVELSEGEP